MLTNANKMLMYQYKDFRCFVCVLAYVSYVSIYISSISEKNIKYQNRDFYDINFDQVRFIYNLV